MLGDLNEIAHVDQPVSQPERQHKVHSKNRSPALGAVTYGKAMSPRDSVSPPIKPVCTLALAALIAAVFGFGAHRGDRWRHRALRARVYRWVGLDTCRALNCLHMNYAFARDFLEPAETRQRNISVLALTCCAVHCDGIWRYA
jgi:hypothetical protein